MKKFNYIVLLVLLCAFGSISAQNNTASAGGDWNNCATWGNPSAIYQNATDTKTINNGVTVTQNTVWSTGAIQLNGNGAVSFANSGNAVIFGTDNGNDQSCCNIATPTATVTQPTCSNGKVGSIVISAQSGAQYSINNGTSYQASNTFSNLAPGTYTLKVKDATCASSSVTQNLNNPACTASFTESGKSTNGFVNNVVMSGSGTADISISGNRINFLTAGTYTVNFTLNVFNAYGNSGFEIFFTYGSQSLTTSTGNFNFSKTITVSAGSQLYIKPFAYQNGAIPVVEQHVEITASGTITKN